MILVTWNCCRGAYSRKMQLLAPLAADVSVVQECARPEVESETCLWFGDNPLQGIAVTAAGPYTLRALPQRRNVPKFVIPIQVTGPDCFTLFAVWSKGDQKYRYVAAVVKAIKTYRELFAGSLAILAGDLNSNVFWDSHHPAGQNHSALIKLLDELGLVSSYHQFFAEEQGQETRPTYYFLWNESKPYHIDYCFVPKVWATRIRRVEVGTYLDWHSHSDHRPLLVELSSNAAERADAPDAGPHPT